MINITNKKSSERKQFISGDRRARCVCMSTTHSVW